MNEATARSVLGFVNPRLVSDLIKCFKYYRTLLNAVPQLLAPRAYLSRDSLRLDMKKWLDIAKTWFLDGYIDQ